jgi:hypothetical protein
MMFSGITNALRGQGGEFEINRVCGAFGTIIYVLGTHAFIFWNMRNGEKFGVTEYCLAFPGGLAVCVAAIAGAVTVKDRGVATAKVISETGAVPAPPPAGPQVPTEPSINNSQS